MSNAEVMQFWEEFNIWLFEQESRAFPTLLHYLAWIQPTLRRLEHYYKHQNTISSSSHAHDHLTNYNVRHRVYFMNGKKFTKHVFYSMRQHEDEYAHYFQPKIKSKMKKKKVNSVLFSFVK